MPSELTTKQQRDQRRAEKVALLKRQQERARRKRLAWIWSGSLAAALVVALVVTLVVTNGGGKSDPVAGSSQIRGLKTFPNLPANHVDPTPVNYQKLYGMDPPAGGNHWAGWLNCGVYDQPQQNERAVHDLEHGAIWITYDPKKVTEAQVTAMVANLPNTYLTVSPYPGLPAPVVASAWGTQVQLTGTKDSRLKQFISAFRRSPNAPEPTSPCTGGFDGPGRVS
jgi:hypothetical protein